MVSNIRQWLLKHKYLVSCVTQRSSIPNWVSGYIKKWTKIAFIFFGKVEWRFRNKQKNGKDANKLWNKFKDMLNHGASNFIASKTIRKQDCHGSTKRLIRSLIKHRTKHLESWQILNQKKTLKFKDLKRNVLGEFRKKLWKVYRRFNWPKSRQRKQEILVHA